MHTFFLEPESWDSHPVLRGAEAHHLIRVLRLQAGTEVILLDGCGREARCRIEHINRQEVQLNILHEQFHPQPASRIVLAAGWGKAARRGWILEKAVELEASELWFWQAERSQFPLPSAIKENWQAQLVAGAKQCQNPWLPVLRTLPGGVRELVEDASKATYRHVLVESDHPHQAMLTQDRLGLPGTTVCVVGPEGGVTVREVQILEQAGFEALSMGTRILRWETAAVMALGLHWWKRQMG